MSIFDDDIDVMGGVKDEIKKFIESNYKYEGTIVISDKPNKSGLYEVSTDGNVVVKNFNITSLTNNLFEWSEVKGDFDCSCCDNLESLEGAPEKVGGR